MNFEIWSSSEVDRLDEASRARLQQTLQDLGEKSGVAQALNGPITSLEKLIGSNHVLILATADDGSGVGFIKYGKKDLYFYTRSGAVIQRVNCDCVLDFYVLEQAQRRGLGLSLFHRMLEISAVPPHMWAYDRPSPKLIAFMRKHFSLNRPDTQPNKFVLFEGFPL